MIADEAHRLRNIESQSSQGFRTLRAQRIWALTGTPIERDAEDIAVLMSLLDPLRFSPDDKSLHPTSLRSRLRPYMLRRRKEDLLNELPQIIEDNELLELTAEQHEAYRKAIVNHTIDGKASFLSLFNKLRMICDIDPATGASSKLDRIVELLFDIARAGEKAIVFSYILEPLRVLQRRLMHQMPRVGFSVLLGEMTLEQRTKALGKFRSDGGCTALLASTRVASEGLNLTEANHVIFVNLWWNPSANIQARDRVVRIGQSRIVHVETLTCRGTVEERLENILKEKSLTFEELIEALSRSGEDIEKAFFAIPPS